MTDDYSCFVNSKAIPIVLAFSLLLPLTGAEAKNVKVYSIDDFYNNLSQKNNYIICSTIDFKGHSIALPAGSNITFESNCSVLNASIALNGESTIRNGSFYVETGIVINDIIVVRGNHNCIANTTINGGKSNTRFAISAFNAKNTIIKSCSISNIGHNENNTAGIRFEGDCSHSVIKRTRIDSIVAFSNSSGITITQISKDKLFSQNVEVVRCIISNISPSVDGDGIKVLQNHLPANHIIRDCSFINCAKRAIKIQGRGVRCKNVYVSEGCSEAIVDYQNGDCHIVGLKAENLLNVYAGIYIQGSEGAIVLKKVNIEANNTEKKYVRGIKIIKSSWDANQIIHSVCIDRCMISGFYRVLSVDGFTAIDSLTISNCSFASVVNPIEINTKVSYLVIKSVFDSPLGKDRKSISFPLIGECKDSFIDIRKRDGAVDR